MKKVLSLVAALLAVSLPAVGFAITLPKMNAGSPQAPAIGVINQRIASLQSQLDNATSTIGKLNIMMDIAQANLALAKDIAKFGSAAGLSADQMTSAITAANASAGSVANAMMGILSAPGFADSSPGNARTAGGVSIALVSIITKPDVIAANPSAAAASAVQLAYVGTLPSVKQEFNTSGLLAASQTVASSSTFSASAQAQIEADIQKSTSFATANVNIEVFVSTVTTSVNPTVISVSH